MLDAILRRFTPQAREHVDMSEAARQFGADLFDEYALQLAPDSNYPQGVVGVDVYSELKQEGFGALESEAVEGYAMRRQEVIEAQLALMPFIRSGDHRTDEIIAIDLVLAEGAIERIFSHYPFPKDAVSRWTVAYRVSLDPNLIERRLFSAMILTTDPEGQIVLSEEGKRLSRDLFLATR